MVFSERVGRHLRGNAVGYVALFVAFTGTAYAGSKITTNQIKKNAIVTKLIKDGQVKSADVADNGLTGADIDESSLQNVPVVLADGSVTTVKLADSAVTMPKLADAAVSQQKLAFDPATQAELDAVATGAVPANSLGAAEPPAADDQIADGSIDSQDLTDGSIANADLSSAAAIDDAKLGTIDDAGKVSDTALSANIAQLSAMQTFSGKNTFTDEVTVNEGNGEDVFIIGTRTGTDVFDPLSVDLTNNTTSSNQGLATFSNSSGSGVTERILNLQNFDNNSAVGTGILLGAANGGTMTTAIDAADLDIGTALDIGANDIETSGATISAAELEKLDGNPTRSVSLPITAFINSTDAASINFGVSDGIAPDFALINGAPVIEYDDTATGVADSDTIATSFTVPSDYLSGNTFVVKASKDGQTLAVDERMRCATSINGAAVGSTATFTGFPQAITNVPFSPGGTIASGASVGLECNMDDSLGGTTQDDIVRIHSVSFLYSADS